MALLVLYYTECPAEAVLQRNFSPLAEKKKERSFLSLLHASINIYDYTEWPAEAVLQRNFSLLAEKKKKKKSHSSAFSMPRSIYMIILNGQQRQCCRGIFLCLLKKKKKRNLIPQPSPCLDQYI
ncbi:uncharacterized protein LOC144785431 [Lissotriton helveticus]